MAPTGKIRSPPPHPGLLSYWEEEQVCGGHSLGGAAALRREAYWLPSGRIRAHTALGMAPSGSTLGF